MILVVFLVIFIFIINKQIFKDFRYAQDRF